MEKISEILNNVKERMTNPFFSSFILAWMTYNWEIIVGLFWYDDKLLESENYNSIFELIRYTTRDSGSYLYPLFIAFCYTFFSPIVRNVVRAFYSWNQKWGSNWSYNISGGGKVGVDKYLRLSIDYEKRTKVLEEILSKENKTLDALNAKTTELIEVQKEITILKQKENEFRIIYARYGKNEKFNDVSSFVSKILEQNEILNVGNVDLNGDPLPGAYKELFIVYEYAKQIRTISAIEHDRIRLREGKLIINPTKISEEHRLSLENQTRLSEIYGSYEWNLTSRKTLTNIEGAVIIDDMGRYFLNGKHTFNLRNIRIHQDDKQITLSFDKFNLMGKRERKESLIVVNDKLIQGEDSQENRIEYKRS